MAGPTPLRLNSWKEIAQHLQRDVRTVKRWERERAMPVHRVPGRRGSVFAYADEIAAWLDGPAKAAASPDPPPLAPHPGADPLDAAAGDLAPARHTRLSRPVVLLLVGAGVLAVVVAARSFGARPRALHGLVLQGADICAIDERGDVAWRHTVTAGRVLAPQGRWAYVGSAGAGRPQLLAAALDVADARGEEHAVLYAFDQRGRLLWQHVPADHLRFASGEYGPPWASGGGDVVGFEVDGEPRIAWVIHHRTWWPSLLISLDAGGHVRSRFVNAGWLSQVAVDADRRLLVATGVSNSAAAPVLVVLDLRRLSGSSPEVGGSPYACLSCEAGAAARYLVFPRSEISRATELRLTPPTLAAFPERFEVRVPEGGEPETPESIYEFSRDVELRRASRSDTYWQWHRRLEAAGVLQHTADECRARDDLSIRGWDEKNGWRPFSAALTATGAPPARAARRARQP